MVIIVLYTNYDLIILGEKQLLESIGQFIVNYWNKSRLLNNSH